MSSNFKSLTVGVAAAALSVGVPLAANADTLGIDFAPTAPYNAGDAAEFTLGYEFEDLTATNVVGLGIWSGSVVNGGTVGLWDSGGNLLASATVTPGAPVGTAPWYFTAIAPVALTPGNDYYVGSISDGGYAGAVNPVSVASQIAYLHNAWTYGGLAFPGNQSPSSLEHAWYGGNVELSAVPEPSAWGVMIAGVATAGAMIRRRRRVAA